MILTLNQIEELLEIIKRQHVLFLSESVGSDFLSKEDVKLLKRHGVDLKKLPKVGALEESFRLGMLSDAIGHKVARNMSYTQFKASLGKGVFYPLNTAEVAALNAVKHQNYKDIKGLGNRMSADLQQSFIEVDRKQRVKTEKIIRTETSKAIKERATIGQLASELMKKTKDWSRDFERVADYTMHEAFSQGKTHQIQKFHGKGAQVYMEVLPDACPDCKRLYLGGDGEPLVFNLQILMGNGSNIGRKRADWMPVIPPLHPWCRCEEFHKEEHFEYDPVTRLFSKPAKDYVSPVGRKSKVKIFVDNKEIK